MVYLGIDPSYTNTGVSLVDIVNKKIEFYKISPVGINSTYTDAVNRALFIATFITNILHNNATEILLEEPLISSLMASRLGILSGVLTTTFYNTTNIKSLSVLRPNYVSNINRPIVKEYSLSKKQASVFSVTKILDKLIEAGFEVCIHNDKCKKDGTPKERKLSHDEAEAFIIVLVLLRERELLSKELLDFMIEFNIKFKKEQNITEVFKKGGD